MLSSTDQRYQKRLRLWLRRDFASKKLQMLNDELDSAYGQMRESIWRKTFALKVLTGCGLGYYYDMYIKSTLGKGQYVKKAGLFVFALWIIDSAEKIAERYLNNFDLENEMIGRYEPQVLQNHPRLKGNQGSQNPQVGFYLENSQSAQESTYQNNQSFNWEESKHHNLGKQDAGNRQVEDWNAAGYIKSQHYQNSQNLAWNQDTRELPDYSKSQADWNSQNSWNKGDYVNSNSSQYDSFGNRIPPNYTDDLKNQNSHYPGNLSEDKSNVSPYPEVLEPHENTPNPRHY